MEIIKAGLAWIQFATASVMVAACIVAAIIGFLAYQLVRRRVILARTAWWLISPFAWVAGRIAGPVFLLIVILVLFPDVADWIENSFLTKMRSMQVEFQTWFAAWIKLNTNNSMLSAVIGQRIKSIDFGSILLAGVISTLTSIVFKYLLRVSYLERAHREWLRAHGQKEESISQKIVSWFKGKPKPTVALPPRRVQSTNSLKARVDRLPPAH